MTKDQLFVHTAINGRSNAVTNPIEKEVLRRTVEKWDAGKNMCPYKVWMLYGTNKDQL